MVSKRFVGGGLFVVSFLSGLAPVAVADELHPITPCRIMDTRNTSVGYVAAGTQLNFKVRGNPASAQGGDSVCGVPSRATAVQLSIVGISPSQTGHVLLWPYGQSQPSTSALNVTATETQNSGLFSLLGAGSYDLSLKPIVASAYFVVDVLGYTSPSHATLTGQATGTVFDSVLVVETLEGETVLAFAPDTYPTFQASFESALPGAVDKCVRLQGDWYDGNSIGEQGLFSVRSLGLEDVAFCGPEAQ